MAKVVLCTEHHLHCVFLLRSNQHPSFYSSIINSWGSCLLARLSTRRDTAGRTPSSPIPSFEAHRACRLLHVVSS